MARGHGNLKHLHRKLGRCTNNAQIAAVTNNRAEKLRLGRSVRFLGVWDLVIQIAKCIRSS